MSDLLRPLREPPLSRANIDPDYPYGVHAPRPDLEPVLSKSWLFEIVDRESGVIDQSFTLIMPPSSYTIREPQRVSITKTFANAFVDDYGPDNIQITLKGFSGTSHVFPTFTTRGNSQTFSDTLLLGQDAARAAQGRTGYTGRDAFYKFRTEIIRYKDRAGWEKKELRVYDLADEQAYKCVLLEFTLDRNSDQPVNRYPFTISLFVYQRLDRLKPELKVIQVAKEPISALNDADTFIERVQSAYKDIQDLVNVTTLLRARSLELRTRYNQFLAQTTQLLTSPLDAVKNFINTAFSGIGLAYDTYRAGKYTFERYVQSVELFRATLNEGLKIYGFQISEGWQVSKTITLERDRGIVAPINLTESVSRGVSLSNYEYSGLNVYTVKGEDTLQVIAKNELGDEDLWPNIAAVNPSVDSNEDLVPGDEIFLPVQVELSEGANKEQFILTEDTARDPYGSDIRLDSDGNLVIQENSDLALVSGIENVRQAIDLRLSTQIGSMIKQSAYGITAQAGFAGSSAAIRYLKLAIRSTLVADPRIAAVRDMIVSIGSDTLNISMTIDIVGAERSLPVSVAM